MGGEQKCSPPPTAEARGDRREDASGNGTSPSRRDGRRGCHARPRRGASAQPRAHPTPAAGTLVLRAPRRREEGRGWWGSPGKVAPFQTNCQRVRVVDGTHRRTRASLCTEAHTLTRPPTGRCGGSWVCPDDPVRASRSLSTQLVFSRCKVIHMLSGSGVATNVELPHFPDTAQSASPLHTHGYLLTRGKYRCASAYTLIEKALPPLPASCRAHPRGKCQVLR